MKLTKRQTPMEQDTIFTNFIDEDLVSDTIEPQKKVLKHLNRTLSRKRRSAQLQKILPLGTAAAILVVALALWSGIDVNSTSERSDNISDVLLRIDRVECQSSRIIPSLTNEH